MYPQGVVRSRIRTRRPWRARWQDVLCADVGQRGHQAASPSPPCARGDEESFGGRRTHWYVTCNSAWSPTICMSDPEHGIPLSSCQCNAVEACLLICCSPVLALCPDSDRLGEPSTHGDLQKRRSFIHLHATHPDPSYLPFPSPPCATSATTSTARSSLPLPPFRSSRLFSPLHAHLPPSHDMAKIGARRALMLWRC